MNQLTSQQVKQAFTSQGVKVRVADQGGKFRICRYEKLGVDLAHDMSVSGPIAASLGLYDTAGNLGGQINQSHELIAYKASGLRVFGIVR